MASEAKGTYKNMPHINRIGRLQRPAGTPLAAFGGLVGVRGVFAFGLLLVFGAHFGGLVWEGRWFWVGLRAGVGVLWC